MSPSAVQRPGRDRKRIVPYYVSQKALRKGFAACELKSVNARELDRLVSSIVLDHINDRRLSGLVVEEQRHWIRELVDRVRLGPDALLIWISCSAADKLRAADLPEPASGVGSGVALGEAVIATERGDHTELRLAVSIKKRDGRRLVLSPDGEDLVTAKAEGPREEIVDAIGHAYRWQDELGQTGESIAAYAKRERVSESRMHKVLPLVLLGPDVLSAALRGSLPPRVTLKDLMAAARDLDWQAQLRFLGMAWGSAGW